MVDKLRQDGHNVVYLSEMDPGISDDVVLSLANNMRALLLTADKDFGESRIPPPTNQCWCLADSACRAFAQAKAELVAAVVRDHSTELPGAFSVLSPGMIRIRN